MHTFIKTQVALIAGSLADFLLTYLLTDVFHHWYIIANAAGNITGAVAQFVLSRYWIFAAPGRQGNTRLILKFILMWTGSIVLSGIGVYIATQFLHLHYLVSKLVLSVLIGTSYTYLLSKKFVFK